MKQKLDFKLIKNKKAFTLIELLAVIVILAIIALITTPVVLNVINEAKVGSFKESVHGIVNSAEQGYSLRLLEGEEIENTIYEYENGSIKSQVGNIEIRYKGAKPNYGTLIINIDGEVAVAFYDNGYCAIKRYDSDEIIVEKKEKEECIIDDEILETPIESDFSEEKGVNKPQLADGMIPIKWDSENNEIETTANDPEWYDYSSKKWANAKTADGSYWVWIPRYAYKMISGYHSSTAGEFDIVFLKGTTIENKEGKVIETSGYNADTKNTSMHYFLHPAFNQGNEEIIGYWVAKFEPTAVEGVSTITGKCTGDDVTTKTIKIIPNATSWRCITIGNAFTNVKNMKNKSTYGWNASEVDTHMMTNYEWGAVAYLSHSKYGVQNEEIWNNAYNQYKTGCSGTGVDAASESTCIEYNTGNGPKASTTGNITGIYDISGGAYEIVAAYVNNGHTNLTTYGTSLVNESSLKYKNVYIKASTDDRPNNYSANKNIYGDAVWETSSTGEGATSWYGDSSYMTYTLLPFFNRGGCWNNASSAGVFIFYSTAGDAIVYSSFRPVFVAK